jgi:hypothetical protein
VSRWKKQVVDRVDKVDRGLMYELRAVQGSKKVPGIKLN